MADTKISGLAAVTTVDDTDEYVVARSGASKKITGANLKAGMPTGGPPTGTAGGVLGGTYPNPSFAADMATQAELDAHTGDTTDAHDASAISFSPTGTVAATDVQAAIAEVASEAVGGSGIPASTFDAKGDLIVASAADTAARLAVGTNDHVLTADSSQSTGVKWAAAPGGGIAATLIDAKGDLIAGSAADTAARLAVGSNGQVLTADSAQSTGIKWATPSGGGGGAGDGWIRQRTGATEDRWYWAGGITGTTWAGGTVTANRLYAVPFVPSKDMTIDGMGFVVNGSASGNARVGIYEDDGNLYPAALVDESAAMSTNADGPIKDTSSFAAALTGGDLYWFAFVTSTASAGFRGPSAGGLTPILGVPGSSLALTACGYGWYVAHTYGALPNPYTGSGTVIADTTWPLIFARGS